MADADDTTLAAADTVDTTATTDLAACPCPNSIPP